MPLAFTTDYLLTQYCFIKLYFEANKNQEYKKQVIIWHSCLLPNKYLFEETHTTTINP